MDYLHTEASDLVLEVIINATNLNTLGEKILTVNQGQLHFVNTMVIWRKRQWHPTPVLWKIPWMEEPGRLQSMGSLRVGHD